MSNQDYLAVLNQPGSGGYLTREQVDDLFKKLNEPFDPADIKWKPQTVNYSAKTALAVAHADPRAYIDRLNDVLGINGWSSEIRFVVTPFTKFIKGKKAWRAPADAPTPPDQQIPGNKVLCVCTVTIPGVGSHCSTGDSDASDENAATSAEAQAFKRACMQFGIGRYLYDLPKQTVRYEDFAFATTPTLPDWAIPKTPCEKCGNNITEFTVGDVTYAATQIINNSLKKHNHKYCGPCQRELNSNSPVAARTKA